MRKEITSSLFVNGLLIIVLGITMLIPATAGAFTGDPNGTIFSVTSTFCLFIGTLLSLAMHRPGGARLTIRSGFAITALAWVTLALFGAIPFVYASPGMTITDAFFESMSGLTTTGATVISSLDTTPSTILLWRSLLQWLGGLGIIVVATAILPLLQIGGMQLFKAEAFDAPEKVLPSAAQISTTLTSLYTGFTILCTIAYAAAGMTSFDAIIHAMATISTGGFSSHDASFAYFESPAVRGIAIVFMMVGSLPFLLYVRTLQGHFRDLIDDEQVRAFFALLLIFSTLSLLAQTQTLDFSALSAGDALFSTVSIITGTGFTTTAYDHWGPAALFLFLNMMVIGGCGGSTSCGIKVFRFQVFWKTLRQNLFLLIYPNGIRVPSYNKKPLDDSVIASVMTFLLLYILSIAFVCVLVSLNGYDLLCSLSTATTMMSNVGPALGPIAGVEGNFATFPDQCKWLFSIAMLAGRLELLAVFVPFSRAFWRV